MLALGTTRCEFSENVSHDLSASSLAWLVSASLGSQAASLRKRASWHREPQVQQLHGKGALFPATLSCLASLVTGGPLTTVGQG